MLYAVCAAKILYREKYFNDVFIFLLLLTVDAAIALCSQAVQVPNLNILQFISNSLYT